MGLKPNILWAACVGICIYTSASLAAGNVTACLSLWQEVKHLKRTHVNVSGFHQARFKSGFLLSKLPLYSRQKNIREAFRNYQKNQDLSQLLADIDVLLAREDSSISRLLPDDLVLLSGENTKLTKPLLRIPTLVLNTSEIPKTPYAEIKWLVNLVQALFQHKVSMLLKEHSSLFIQKTPEGWQLSGPIKFSKAILEELYELERVSYKLLQTLESIYKVYKAAPSLPSRSGRPGIVRQSLHNVYSLLPLPSNSSMPLSNHRLNRRGSSERYERSLQYGLVSQYGIDQWRRAMWPSVAIGAVGASVYAYNQLNEKKDLFGVFYRAIVTKMGENLSEIVITQEDINNAQKQGQEYDLQQLELLVKSYNQESDPELKKEILEAIKTRREIMNYIKDKDKL